MPVTVLSAGLIGESEFIGEALQSNLTAARKTPPLSLNDRNKNIFRHITPQMKKGDRQIFLIELAESCILNVRIKTAAGVEKKYEGAIGSIDQAEGQIVYHFDVVSGNGQEIRGPMLNVSGSSITTHGRSYLYNLPGGSRYLLIVQRTMTRHWPAVKASKSVSMETTISVIKGR